MVLWLRRLARWVGAGGKGMGSTIAMNKKGSREKKKPPGNRGGFFLKCRAGTQLHETIMHDPCDVAGDRAWDFPEDRMR
jgi:hypothetical protein